MMPVSSWDTLVDRIGIIAMVIDVCIMKNRLFVYAIMSPMVPYIILI